MNSISEEQTVPATPVRVAIQGQSGCYHEKAALEYFAGRKVEIVPC